MRQHFVSFSIVLLFAASSAFADVIEYQVSANTSSISGTAGSLDFNFNPGPLVTQAASLQILGFSGDGILAGGPIVAENVAGALPATITFNNGSGFNDYFEEFTFGTTLDFNISLYGPALSSPNGISTSGSTFAFSMFSDAAGTMPVLTSDITDGFALTVNVNLDGTTTLDNFSQETLVSAVTTVPEPSTGLLGTSAVVIIVGSLLVKRRRVRC